MKPTSVLNNTRRKHSNKTDAAELGSWVRQFLLEHLVASEIWRATPNRATGTRCVCCCRRGPRGRHPARTPYGRSPDGSASARLFAGVGNQAPLRCRDAQPAAAASTSGPLYRVSCARAHWLVQRTLCDPIQNVAPGRGSLIWKKRRWRFISGTDINTAQGQRDYGLLLFSLQHRCSC